MQIDETDTSVSTGTTVLSPSDVQPQLIVDPAFLVRLVDHIIRLTVADQEWRQRIVLSHIRPNLFSVCISITIPAHMTACIICSDISSEQTGAFSVSLILSASRDIQPGLECFLIC